VSAVKTATTEVAESSVYQQLREHLASLQMTAPRSLSLSFSTSHAPSACQQRRSAKNSSASRSQWRAECSQSRERRGRGAIGSGQ
jgi:hypothetical protein